MAAPLQGLTEAAWRHAHFDMFGSEQGNVEYFTPFIRVEKGAVRARDLRDFTSELNQGISLTPQIIFRDVDEWRMLVDTLAESGATRIDMNMGCPFPPQLHKGRGAGILLNPDVVSLIADAMRPYTDSIVFSVKMRLGVKDPREAMALADILNSMPLRHITVHPRTAAQQYKGDLRIDEMNELKERLRHPVIFNGEVSSPSDIAALTEVYDGVMVGRGLLARPSMLAEYRSGREWPAADRNSAYIDLLKNTQSLLEHRLCGTAQLRDKMKPYWQYAPESVDRKTVKAGKKYGIV